MKMAVNELPKISYPGTSDIRQFNNSAISPESQQGTGEQEQGIVDRFIDSVAHSKRGKAAILLTLGGAMAAFKGQKDKIGDLTEENLAKDKIIEEKDKEIEEKDEEIKNLKETKKPSLISQHLQKEVKPSLNPTPKPARNNDEQGISVDLKNTTEVFGKLSNKINATEAKNVMKLILDNKCKFKEGQTIVEISDQYLKVFDLLKDQNYNNPISCANSAFKEIMNNLKPGEDIQSATEEYYKLKVAMKICNIDDSINAYKLIDDAIGTDFSNRSVYIDQYVKVFDLLKDQNYNNPISCANSAFKEIMNNLKPGEDIQSATEEYYKLKVAMKICNIDDSINAYKLIDGYAKNSKQRQELTDLFLGILKKEGSSNVEKAKKCFTDLVEMSI
jgi:hypothetical protein